MCRYALAVCAWCSILGFQLASAQGPATLPVQRVVLYKNGVGYFEHLGKVRNNQAISVDFNSAQLDDVLKSLTALDLANGRVSGISYNSEAPFAQRLGALRLPIGDRATLPELLMALRGARLEVRDGARLTTGRLLGVERRTVGSGPSASTRDEMTLVSDAGEIRIVQLTPAVAVKLAERDSAEQVGGYLGALASTRAPDRHRMTIATTGAGDRDLLVSYVSEVPIWKTNYRIVLDSRGQKPLLQGWAIIDNTTGQDWSNVKLSLVAGAPQSFIEQLSQPRYGRRPVVQPLQGQVVTPQTHGATLSERTRSLEETVTQGASAPANGRIAGIGGGRGVGGGVAGGLVGGLQAAPPPPAAQIVGTVALDRLQEAQAMAFGQQLTEMFEYRLTNPISIPRNQSALVPIISAHASVERVSLWNGRLGGQPLRALWLTNTTGLTLDGGSFTVLDDGTFGGEGLIEAVKPEERRLLSYAVDQGMQIESRSGDDSQVVSRVVIQQGVIIEQREQRSRRVYTVRNNDTSDRALIIEHPRRAGWTLRPDIQPAETSAAAYRFRVDVPAKQTKTFTVDEKQPVQNRYEVSALPDGAFDVLVRDTSGSDKIKAALRPITEKEQAAGAAATAVQGLQVQIDRATADELRVRENLRVLKGTKEEKRLASRYATQLEEFEVRITELRRQQTEQARAHDQAVADVEKLLQQLALDVTLEE